MTIAVTGAEQVLEQIIKQLSKLVDVIAVRELDSSACVRREIMLVSLLQILHPLAFWGVIRRNALYKRQ
jgi:acetolactate synthase small subunit